MIPIASVGAPGPAHRAVPVPLPRVVAVAVVGPTRHCAHFNQPQTRSRLDVSGTHQALPYGVSEDHYLDIRSPHRRRGRSSPTSNELLDAVRHGLLTPTVAEQAVRHAVDAPSGISARNGYDLTRWLATRGDGAGS